MIDEFQDTSRMQWDNFKLLLLEGLSQGADSLIVGDVKQSIYRWRNGDWGILNGLNKQLRYFSIRTETLKPTVEVKPISYDSTIVYSPRLWTISTKCIISSWEVFVSL